jgi:hypothetical protein
LYQRFCALGSEDAGVVAGCFAALGLDGSRRAWGFAQSQRPSFVLRI